MTAADCIALLDDMLAEYGETIILRRGAVEASVLASVRGIKAEELVGTATVNDLMVVVSSTGLDTFGLPKVNDKAVVKGRERQVKFADIIYVNDVWVRCNLVVAG